MHEICQPVFEEIDKLVKHQVNEVRLKRMDEGHPKGAAIKAIFLVGGFGESAFLKDSLVATHKNIQIIQPNGAYVNNLRDPFTRMLTDTSVGKPSSKAPPSANSPNK